MPSTARRNAILVAALLGVLLATLITTYGLPMLLAPELYVLAKFTFIKKTFANDWGTVGTDYGLTALMVTPAIYMLTRVPQSRFRDRSASLLLFYALSVLVGAISHQNFDTVSSMNTPTFRIMWSVCVGSVTAAGGYIGSIGSALAHMSNRSPRQRFKVVQVPRWWWVSYAIILTLMVFCGFFSMERPAADIFLAGITQTPPTVYLFLCLMSNDWGVGMEVFTAQIVLGVGAFLNAPLLPLYGILVRMGLSLGTVNTILHFWLAAAWGSQAYGCLVFSRHIELFEANLLGDQKKMLLEVPVKKNGKGGKNGTLKKEMKNEAEETRNFTQSRTRSTSTAKSKSRSNSRSKSKSKA